MTLVAMGAAEPSPSHDVSRDVSQASAEGASGRWHGGRLGPVYKGERGEMERAILPPSVVAFSFGLLHGLGFGGALKEIGLPAGEIPLALLAFNVGVELGQLAIVALALATVFSLRLLLDA